MTDDEQEQRQEEEQQTQIYVPEVAANVDINIGDEHQKDENKTSNGEVAEQLQQIVQQEAVTNPEQQRARTPITTAELEQILKEIEEMKNGQDGRKRQQGPSPTDEEEQQKAVSDKENDE